MTKPSEAAKAKACELLNAAAGSSAVWKPEFIDPSYNKVGPAFATFIQQVSDAAKIVAKEISKSPDGNVNYLADERLAPFILPEPVDPLVAAMKGCGWNGDPVVDAAALRAELTRRGLKIVEASHDG